MFHLSKLRFRREPPPESTTAGLFDSAPKLFVHIPKTAGTSFRKSFVKLFGQRKVIQDYGALKAETSAPVRDYIHPSGDWTRIKETIVKSGAVLVCGHFHVSRYGGILGLPNTFTFVRQPTVRVVSHYRHVVRHKDYKQELMVFAREKLNRNQQSRLMSHLDPALIGIVGITEHYGDSIELINARWGWDIGHREDNVGDQLGDLQVQLSSEQELEIRALEAKDIVFYDRALHVFKNSRMCLQKAINAEPRGAITLASAQEGVMGWGLSMASEAPLEVDVLVNGEQLGCLKCVDFRAGLAGWRISRHGYVGFQLRQVKLTEGDQVEIYDSRYQLLLDSTVILSPA